MADDVPVVVGFSLRWIFVMSFFLFLPPFPIDGWKKNWKF
jgi:hypothetical protein